MRIYKHRSFHQWAKSEGLTDSALKKAIEEMENGLYEANLGSGLYKKRVALPQEKEKVAVTELLWRLKKKKMLFLFMVSRKAFEQI